ncbi:MAG TPA: hypothetical protein VEA59_01000 [Patescibacteria group bacterium]|nr:hypothetical protein [Patescibacteria group bacterium]
MLATDLYYNRIISILEDYLGPAAGRFANRQVMTYLKKTPDQLERRDLQMLAIRIRSGLVVLTKDEQTVNEAYQRILSLGDL